MEGTSLDSKLSGKHHAMERFIDTVQTYRSTGSQEDTLNKHLQYLGVAIDLSIFDPNSSVVCQFFVSLHELLNSLEARSMLAWNCVKTLSNACRNAAARSALIHAYQFIPPLARLLNDHLSVERKVELLTVMQELSCGMKVSWQIPHLKHLLCTLTNWIENERVHMNVTTLALGVLVNMCHKNLPAIYMLSRCVDIRQFLRMCSQLEGSGMQINVYKLLIVLDKVSDRVRTDAFVKLLKFTFESISNAFQEKNVISLRQVVEFFLDMAEENTKMNIDNRQVIMSSNENYGEAIRALLSSVENNITNGAAGDSLQNEPECLAIIFQFVRSLIEMDLPDVRPLYLNLMTMCLNWVQTEPVCSEALAIIKTVVTSLPPSDEMLTSLHVAVPHFALCLEDVNEDAVESIEQCKKLGAMMQIMRILVCMQQTSECILGALNERTMSRIFAPLFGKGGAAAGNANSYTTEANSLYVHALALISELAVLDADWESLANTLLRHRMIQTVLAQSLYSGDKEVKSAVLRLSSFKHFPHTQIAAELCEIQPAKQPPAPSSTDALMQNDLLCYQILSVSQSQQLDEVIERLKEAHQSRQLANTAISDVIELYQLKLASMAYAERAASMSVEASSQRCIHLQHQNAQLNAEISRTRQLMLHVQHQAEHLRKTVTGLESSNKNYVNCLQTEKGRVKVLKNQLDTVEKQLDKTTRQLQVAEQERDSSSEKNRKLKDVNGKLQENSVRLEKNNCIKDEALKQASQKIDSYRMNEVKMERQLAELRKELLTKTDLINAITQLTTNSNTSKLS